MEDLRQGLIVISRAGRDKGRLFVVLGTSQDLILVADGRLRRVEKPKAKKSKHLEPLVFFECRTLQKILDGEKVTNSEIRRMLSEYREKAEENGGHAPAAETGK